MKRLKLLLMATTFFSCLLPFNIQAQENVLNFTDRQIPPGVLKQISRGKIADLMDVPSSKSNGKNWGNLEIVELRGKTNHFGRDISVSPPEFIDWHATVPDVNVWISEYPFTRDADIKTDETGWWTMHVIKYKCVDLEFSFIYEKEGWVTTKSNVITINGEDKPDLGIQFIDPYFYYYAMKPGLDQLIQALLGDPSASLENAVVVTVGKSWASLHNDLLPHGDPGAITTIAPPAGSTAVGPIYFNEAVVPDPTQLKTSVDGGVAWFNIPLGTYSVTAEKDGFIYETVKFAVAESDQVNGVELYISSSPYSVEGNNGSAPGED